MIEVEEAITRLIDATPVQTKVLEVGLLQARNGIIAKDIYARVAVPHYPKSGMDGYAIRSQDSSGATKTHSVKLNVIGEICAGDKESFPALPGTAVRIMTGGRVPEGFDCVIMQEDTDMGEEYLNIYKEMNAWDNYCHVGEDISVGQLVIKKYTRLTSCHIGILASLGYYRVPLLEPIRVGIIATGNELIKPGQELDEMQIYNNSSYHLAAQLEDAGLVVTMMEICPDDVEHFVQLIKLKKDEADVFITTGGVSVGKKDIIPDALTKLKAKTLFRRVKMKPGTPVLASSYEDKIILSLSGNPFAAVVNFQLFFWPIIAKAMQNDSYCVKKSNSVIVAGRMKPSGLRRFIRAFVDEQGVHLYTKTNFSSVFSNLVDSNCMIDQDPGQEIKEGDQVKILINTY